MVLVADYPRCDGSVALYYVHTRNLYYASHGIEVHVLNFAADEDYQIDGIRVYSPHSPDLALVPGTYDALVLHAPNLRNHYRFLQRYHHIAPNLLFVFHGHEVLRCSKVYPEPYAFRRERLLDGVGRDLYDIVKLRVWRAAFERLASKSWFVFVSNWLRTEFFRWVRIDPAIVRSRSRVIYNSVGSAFEEGNYDRQCPKDYDFVTVRSFLDGSKYCIDVVTDIARHNPKLRFCVVGRGDFYRFYEKPHNVVHIDRSLNHSEIVALLNRARGALLPTRTDAQGVMACEVATFGMPLITSDIAVSAEVFAGFGNVAFIDNQNPMVDIAEVLNGIAHVDAPKNERYFARNTSGAEVELLQSILIGKHGR